MATNAETYYWPCHSTCEPHITVPPSVIQSPSGTLAILLRIFPEKGAPKTPKTPKTPKAPKAPKASGVETAQGADPSTASLPLAAEAAAAR